MILQKLKFLVVSKKLILAEVERLKQKNLEAEPQNLDVTHNATMQGNGRQQSAPSSFTSGQLRG